MTSVKMKSYLFLKLLLLNSVSCKYHKIYNTPANVIRQTTTKNDKLNFTYLIQQPEGTITTIRIFQLKFTECNNPRQCCDNNYLSISGSRKRLKFCNNDPKRWLSLRSDSIEVLLKIEKGNVDFWMEYKSRNASECPGHEFQCLDKSSCYNSSQICDLQFACRDHSDELGCRHCGMHLTPCDNLSLVCFDPIAARCDRRLDCPKGEDEQGCSEKCNLTSIECTSNVKCISPHQLCNNRNDCSDGFDETNCARQYCRSPPYFLCNNGLCIDEKLVGDGRDDCGDISDEMNLLRLVTICAMALSIVFLTILFTGLVVRWCSSRRDVYRLLQNLPEFPLPPFQAPEDRGPHEHYNLGYSDSDFRVGGDVFEAFARFRRRMDTNNKNDGSNAISIRTNTRYSNFNSPGPDGDIEIIKALVSLSLPHKMCIGLDRYIIDIIESNSGIVIGNQQKNRRTFAKT